MDEGIITDITGPLLYKIKLTDGTKVRCHVDSVKQRNNRTVTTEVTLEFERPASETSTSENTESQLVTSTPMMLQLPEQSELLTGLQRSNRIRKPSQRYTDLQSQS